MALLHFESYEKIARAHVNEAHEAARLRVLFGDGVAAYNKQDFDKALSVFRQVALASPTYPQLGQYLVQSEAAVERKRTSDLSDAKRQEATQAFAKGMASLEKGDYAEAKTSFEAVLALDPAHPQAKLYLQQIESQKTRRTDPVAGQQHYEAGLIAFVGGDMEQAIREWHIALRFDPENPKVDERFEQSPKGIGVGERTPLTGMEVSHATFSKIGVAGLGAFFGRHCGLERALLLERGTTHPPAGAGPPAGTPAEPRPDRPGCLFFDG